MQVRIACSWNLNAGRDAAIEAIFYGTEGGAQMRNENGPFFDSRLICSKAATSSASPLPRRMGGRAAVDWVKKLAAGARFSGSTSGLLETARTLDRLYGRP